jgi:monoamine oxidase
MRVVVVGAGFAGLNAASQLRDAGCDVVLIEGGHRPGGRVRTVHNGFVDGQYSESGAEWVDDIHPRLLGLLDRYGIGLLGTGEQWTVIRRWLHRNGELLSADQMRAVDPGLDEQFDRFETIIAAATDGVADPAHPDLHPEAAAVDALSLADAVAQAGYGELAALFARRDAQGEFASEPSQVSLLFVAQQRAFHRVAAQGRTVTAYRVVGGFSQVARNLADELGERVNYGETLTAIAQDADGVTITTDRRTLHADHVVLACSLVPLRTVTFHDPMPALLHRAVQELGYGTVTKTSVQWSAREWRPGYATTEGRLQRVYEPTAAQPGEAGILMSYCGGDGGHQWARMSESERIRVAAEGMREMHHLTAEVRGGYSRAWSVHPRYGGSYAAYQPTQITEFWDVLRRPWGRVHLAGEHVATCTGYIEGALESGETVATRLITAG